MLGAATLGIPTEMTVQDLFQEELRKRGVKVASQVSFVTPVGRMQPDIVLRNGAQYVVETKLGPETKLLDAMIQLYNYSKYVAEAKGAFAVLFPEELRRPWPQEIIRRLATDPKAKYSVVAIFKDLRPSQPFKGNLNEIADWIASHVLRIPPVEVSTDFAIRVLRNAVSFITAIIKQLKGEDLADIFGGKAVFQNILQYEEGRYPLEEMRQAAAYLLVNQLLFYHVLAKVGVFEPLDENKIEKPSDLARYFEPVLRQDYTSVFGFDVASRLPDNASDVVKKVVMALKALAPEKIRHDILGKVFHELIPLDIRKKVAAFYTNNEAAEILAYLAIEDSNEKVIDLASGSGTLLVAPYRCKRDLLVKEKGEFTFEDHKRFLEEDLTGIDIMPFAAHLGVVSLSLQALLAGHKTERVRIAVWDSTELKPNQKIPVISSELTAAYHRTTLSMFMDELPEQIEKKMAMEKISLEHADVVIMNPPFTRQELLPKDYKQALARRFSEYAKYLHGQLGLYGYFIFLADRFVKKDGRIALVLPSSILRIRSAKGVRELLVKKYYIKYIITTWKKAAFSESAKFREILLVASKTDTVNEEKICSIVNLKHMPKNLQESRWIARNIKSASKEHRQIDDENMVVFFVTQKQLKDNIENWFNYIAAYNPETLKIFDGIEKRAGNKLVRLKYNAQRFDLGHLKKDNIHGFVVRYRDRARKRTDRYYVTEITRQTVVAKDRFLLEEARIPLSSLGYGLRSSSGVKTIDVSAHTDFVVLSKFKHIIKVCPTVTDITLRKWKEKVEEKASNFLIARRFVLPAPGLSVLAFYSDTPIVGVDMWCIKELPREEAKLQALWFNSTLNLLQVYLLRTLDTWMKIHDYTLEEFLSLNTKVLTEKQKKGLLTLFEEIGTIELPSIVGQLKQKHPMRSKLDKTLLNILGYTENEADNLLDKLYPLIIDEIERLKIFMRSIS